MNKIEWYGSMRTWGKGDSLRALSAIWLQIDLYKREINQLIFNRIILMLFLNFFYFLEPWSFKLFVYRSITETKIMITSPFSIIWILILRLCPSPSVQSRDCKFIPRCRRNCNLWIAGIKTNTRSDWITWYSSLSRYECRIIMVGEALSVWFHESHFLPLDQYNNHPLPIVQIGIMGD